MSLKVYFPTGNPRGAKVLIAAELADVKVEHVEITYDSLKTEEHLRRHPLGKVPVLEDENGPIFESKAILRYIARANTAAGLYGSTLHDQALVDQWLDFVSQEIEVVFYDLVIPVLGYHALEQQAGAKAHADLSFKLKVLDNHLKGKDFFVGTKLTIADIEVQNVVNGIFRFIVDEKQRETLPDLVRWFNTTSNLPEFIKHQGRARSCKHSFPALQITHAQQNQAKQQQPKAEKQPKQPKEEKKKEPKVEAAHDEEEEEEKPKKKEVNPLDLLPPTKFDLDNWKRQFLAAKGAEAQKKEFEFFWQNFDAEGWSIWEVLYDKDPETEGKVLVRSNNSMNGFLQRSDPHFRKYAFAIHGVYGDEPNLEIRGAWLWRGTEVTQELKDHPSYEVNKFIKLDPKSEADRQLYEDYWLNQTEDESKVKGLTARTLVYYR